MPRFSLLVALVASALAAPAAAQAPASEAAGAVSAPIADIHYRVRFDAAHGVMRSVGVEMTFDVRGATREEVVSAITGAEFGLGATLDREPA